MGYFQQFLMRLFNKKVIPRTAEEVKKVAHPPVETPPPKELPPEALHEEPPIPKVPKKKRGRHIQKD